VILLPGTGTGVARLVEVSMVNVDMARSSNVRALTPLAEAHSGGEMPGTFNGY
jgi:hypothetical protein